MQTAEITVLLKAWAAGDEAASQRLMPLIYGELLSVANRVRYRAGMPRGNIEDTLQTNGLVHEAWLRMATIHNVDWQDRGHFFAVSAQLMRRILVDRARARLAAKRGGPDAAAEHIDPEAIAAPEPAQAREIARLDDALRDLAKLDPRRSRVVELRVFAGLNVDETAAVMGMSPQTVMRDWKVAKAWLLRELAADAPGTAESD